LRKLAASPDELLLKKKIVVCKKKKGVYAVPGGVPVFL
jgi:hypothetical protein